MYICIYLAIRKAVDNGKVLQEGQRFKLSDAAKAAAKVNK